ncbi:MAG: hypothetical protein ACKPKO_32450, partial [Candidatus Fonsibacter sp.]
MFTNGALLIDKSVVDQTGAFDDIVASLSGIWKFDTSTGGRFLKVETTSNMMLPSHLTGSGSIIQYIRARKLTSEYYIHGRDRLDGQTRSFVVVASLCANPDSSMLMTLLENDRLLLK